MDGSLRLSSELTEPQVVMLSWLDFYNWIFGPEGPDPKPDTQTIENDQALDDFIENWKDKKNKPSDPNRKHMDFSG